jgi:hypothetical protein
MPRGKSKATWAVLWKDCDGLYRGGDTGKASRKECLAWIRAVGLHEQDYIIARMEPPIRVQVETIEHRKLDFGTPTAPKPKRTRKAKATPVVNADGKVTCPVCEGTRRNSDGKPCMTCNAQGFVDPPASTPE